MKKGISKRKSPFFSISKGLSNKQKKIFMSYCGNKIRTSRIIYNTHYNGFKHY